MPIASNTYTCTHRRSVTRNFRGHKVTAKNFLRGTAIRAVTIFSLSYRKILKIGGGGRAHPYQSEDSKKKFIFFGGGGTSTPPPPKMYGRTAYAFTYVDLKV